MDNPKLAIDALLEDDKKIGKITIHPITIARYALLELADCPYINNSSKATSLNIMTSVYILQADIQELKQYNSKNIDKLVEKSIEWGEGIDADGLNAAVDEMTSKFSELFKISPSTGGVDDQENGKSVKKN